ncbi:hypothetical protein Dvina_45090 [Dactylosporangium vinaceum]|uniref:Uncharacterized protein n=1 Tax=Dactylosporangium vinaceum TaxID=53362 RepID=A0ABV5MJC8_9ACTN|nr:hypothetical protein [Dactylosporangium vinaceum]UAB95151.1 hypothetical protein Dvina_45090 [Dactylosporangium vinaceum]
MNRSLARHGGHTEWCARDHSCGLGEHRARPVTGTTPHVGTFTLTRIQHADRGEFAEIRLSIRLAPGRGARAHLAHLLRLLERFISHATTQQ